MKYSHREDFETNLLQNNFLASWGTMQTTASKIRISQIANELIDASPREKKFSKIFLNYLMCLLVIQANRVFPNKPEFSHLPDSFLKFQLVTSIGSRE